MEKIINGRAIAEKINRATAIEVVKLKKNGITPKLAVVLVGGDKPSLAYIGRKQKVAQDVGIDFALHRFNKSITKAELLMHLKKIQTDSKLSGLIIQLPLPQRLYTSEVLNAIKPELDVDFLTDVSLGKIVSKSHPLYPPTPSVVLDIMREINMPLKGKNVAVIGAGFLVGKPLSILLMNAEATVTICNVHTKNLTEICRASDIIISCAGKKDLVRGKMVKHGAVVIDIGYSFADGVYSGDVNVPEVSKVASFVTPTPGGVGPITVAKLLSNVARAARLKK